MFYLLHRQSVSYSAPFFVLVLVFCRLFMVLVDSEQADSYADSLDSPPEPWLPSLHCFYFDETSILSVGGESHPHLTTWVSKLASFAVEHVKLWNHISHSINRRICPLAMTSWCRLCCNPAGDVAPRCYRWNFGVPRFSNLIPHRRAEETLQPSRFRLVGVRHDQSPHGPRPGLRCVRNRTQQRKRRALMAHL